MKSGMGLLWWSYFYYTALELRPQPQPHARFHCFANKSATFVLRTIMVLLRSLVCPLSGAALSSVYGSLAAHSGTSLAVSTVVHFWLTMAWPRVRSQLPWPLSSVRCSIVALLVLGAGPPARRLQQCFGMKPFVVKFDIGSPNKNLLGKLFVVFLSSLFVSVVVLMIVDNKCGYNGACDHSPSICFNG